MSEVHRYKVVKMLSEVGNRINYDPHGPEVVMASAYDESLSQLAALREELDKANGRHLAELMLRDRELEIAAEFHSDLQQRLADAEQRNAELIILLREHANHVATLTDVMFRHGVCMGSREAETKIYAALAHQQLVNAALTKPEEAKS